MDDKEFKEKYDKLKNSKFRQQKLPGWRPVPTLSCITIIYLSFAVFFILFGIIILVFNSQVQEIKFRYDNWNQTNSRICSFNIPEKMKKPIMIYYQIDDFSQNHRVYMESKSDKQLKGEDLSKGDLEKSGECEYALTNKEMNIRQWNTQTEEEEVAIPCGLMAKSYLRDEFNDWKNNGKEIKIRIEDIAYKSDKEKYNNIDYDETQMSKQWANMSDERFMIWMRPSPFSNVRKLWGIIDEEDIEKGKVEVQINLKNYFSYKKYIILSTRNVFGGKNMFLGICYIIFGILCLVSSIIFIITFNSFHNKK